MKGEETPGNLAFLPWFPADFRRDTQLLSREAKLLYRELLDLYWEQKGVIPWDAPANGNRIALALGCPQDEWERAWPEVKPYFDIIDGHLRNKRADCELDAAREKQKTKQKAGLAGAKARWKKDADSKRNADANADANGKRHADAMPPIPNPIDLSPDGDRSPPKAPKPDSLLEMAIALVEHLNATAGTSHRTRHDGKSTKGVEMAVALLKSGYEAHEVRQVIDRKTAQWRDDDRMRDCLRPKTLFLPSNFENYVGQLGLPITTAMTHANGNTHDQPKGAITTFAENAFAEAERRDAAQAAHAEQGGGDGPKSLEGARPGLRAVGG